MKRFLLVLIICLFNSKVLAYSECNAQVTSILIDTDSDPTELVWIQFNRFAIFKHSNLVSEKHLDRIYSMALTAYTTQRWLRIRYPEDNLDCASLTGSRHDFIAIRIVNDENSTI